jgi:protein-S-isoprenylcysteine O-methyltransferase Ste14
MSLRYVLGAFIVIGLPPGIAWWFIVHPFVGFWRRLGATRTMTAMGVFFAVTVLGLLPFHRALMGRALPASPQLVVLGFLLIGLGFAIAMARKKHLPMRILAGVPEVHADEGQRGELLTQGIYSMIRHPRYMEIVLITFGYAAISNHVGPWVLAALTFPLIHAVVLLEERELRDRFGEEYREYTALVPRYIPRRWMSASTTSTNGTYPIF